MRTFKNGNWFDPKTVCPVCETQDEGEVVLVPVAGTQQGRNIQAIQVHTKCIGERMVYYPEHNMIFIECINFTEKSQNLANKT